MLPAVLFGLVVGTLTGIMPGINMLVATIVFLPLLSGMEPQDIILWYAVVLVTHQFIGSIIAVYYGVPPQESHWATVIEGHSLYKQGKSGEVIAACVISHLVSLLICLVFICVITQFTSSIMVYFDSNIQVLVILSTLFCILTISKESLFVKLTMVMLAFLLGFAGQYNHLYLHLPISYANIINFTDGFPQFPLVIGIFVIPTLLKNNQELIEVSAINQTTLSFHNINYISTAIIHTFIGFIFGLTPMLTSEISSIISYRLEKYYQTYRKNYSLGNIKTIVASESSAVSGAVVSIMPLLLFGIPITNSEALIYSIVSSKGFIFNFSSYNTLLVPIFGCLVLVAVINYFTSGIYSHIFGKLYRILKYKSTNIIIILLIISVMFYGYTNYVFLEYLITLSIFSIIGYLCRNLNMNAFVFVFLLSNHTFDVFIRFFTLLQLKI
jgi:putative tricarboxylic transport membrane protein